MGVSLFVCVVYLLAAAACLASGEWLVALVLACGGGLWLLAAFYAAKTERLR